MRPLLRHNDGVLLCERLDTLAHNDGVVLRGRRDPLPHNDGILARGRGIALPHVGVPRTVGGHRGSSRSGNILPLKTVGSNKYGSGSKCPAVMALSFILSGSKIACLQIEHCGNLPL